MVSRGEALLSKVARKQRDGPHVPTAAGARQRLHHARQNVHVNTISALPRRRLILAGLPLTALPVLLVLLQHPGEAKPLPYAVVAVVGASLCYLVWHLDPAWTLALGVFLSPIAGYWPQLGVPGQLSPQRLLLVGGILAFILRAPAVRNRPRLRGRPVHWMLAAASIYVLGSAAAAGTLVNKDSFFKLFEAYGILLFAVFFVAPIAFRDERRRRILLGTLVVLGAYLGLTALFETIHASALVWPRYINNPNIGIHFGRARGPFAEAVQNGIGLYTCGLAAVVGAFLYRSRRTKRMCVAVAALDAAGLLFTLQRSVWVGGVVATIVTVLAFKDFRRYAVPVLVAGALIGGVAYAIVGSGAVHARATDQGTVWGRYNLNRAALNMIDARPLLGFGWSTFPTSSVQGEFFQQNFNYPLTAAGESVHNEFLSHGAELGLVGLTIWAAGLVLAAYTALRARARTREESLWKRAFFAYAIFYLIVSSFVPPELFPNLIFWLFAGVVGAPALLDRTPWQVRLRWSTELRRNGARNGHAPAPLGRPPVRPLPRGNLG